MDPRAALPCLRLPRGSVTFKPMRAQLQAVLCSLLGDAIRGRTPRDIPALPPHAWNRLMELALQHSVLAILYPAIAGLPPGTIPESLLGRWHLLTLQAGIQEARRFQEALDLTSALADRSVACVAFKGMVLRALYPQPDLRTMGDIDLLIRPEDLLAAEALLQERGLRPVGVKGHHHAWRSGPGMFIELHGALFEHSAGALEQAFFAHAIPHQETSRSYCAPAPEDAAVYQVLHMAKHFRYLGFGLRELADLVLQCEQGLALSRVLERLDACGTGRFGRAVLLVAHRLLNLNLPETDRAAWSIPQATVAHLAEVILSAGTHGMTNVENALFLAASSQGHGELPNSTPPARWRFLLWLFFPAASELHPRYAYAAKHHGLLPLAWAHRLARAALRAPGAAWAVLRFGGRFLFTGHRRRRFERDLGLFQP